MKKSELKKFIKEEITNILSEVTLVDKNTSTDEISDIAKNEKSDPSTVKKAIGQAKMTGKPVSVAEVNDEEDSDDTDIFDKEPTAKDLNKNDSVSKSALELSRITKEMKSIVNLWKQAEGADKDKYLKRLKELTKIKKELEGLL